MVGLILLLHFGFFQVLALLWQNFGVQTEPIMSAPLRSTSLGEFWGKRWNLGFRQLSHGFPPAVSEIRSGNGRILRLRGFRPHS